jgi:hypothetical protein
MQMHRWLAIQQKNQLNPFVSCKIAIIFVLLDLLVLVSFSQFHGDNLATFFMRGRTVR